MLKLADVWGLLQSESGYGRVIGWDGEGGK